MMKLKRILFPIDFSPAADHTSDYAISLELEHESALVLVHVVIPAVCPLFVVRHPNYGFISL